MAQTVTYSRTALRRMKLFARQMGLCCWCSERMQMEREGPDFATFEHLLPIRFGGKNNSANVALAHKDCNERRQHSFPNIFGKVLTAKQRKWYAQCQAQAKRW